MRFSLIAVVLSFAVQSNAQDSASAWQKLEAAMQAELAMTTKSSGNTAPADRERTASARGNTAPADRERTASARFVLTEVRSAMRSDDTYRIEAALYRVMGFFSSDPVKQAAANLSAAIKKEREAKQNAYIAELNAALKHAADATRTAKDPGELDAPLKELQRYRNPPPEYRLSETGRSAISKVPGTINVLQRWQDYLAAEKIGDTVRARETLQSAANIPEAIELMPCSEILMRLQKYQTHEDTHEEVKAEAPKPEEIDELVAKVKTLDGIADAIKEIRRIQSRTRSSSYSYSDPVFATLNALVSIERTYREFQAGLPTKLEDRSTQVPDATSPSIIRLKVQLLLLVLPQYLKLPSGLAPKSGETVQQFLERVMEEARRRGDGALLTRTRDAQRVLMTGITQFSNDPPEMTFLAAAENQEAAGQFMLAVISYQNALRSGSDAVPAKLIGERLTALKAAHPQDYEQGMARFLNAAPFRFESSLPPVFSGPASSPASLPIAAPPTSTSPSATVSRSPTPSAAPARP